MDAFTSGIVFPVTVAAAARSGVPAELPFCFDVEDSRCLAFSTTDCVEFCLALEEAGLPPFVGAGDPRPNAFVSGNVLRIGEEAIDGDMFEVMVLFLEL
jgi:hypothetical protein